jgi:hypothetical protein
MSQRDRRAALRAVQAAVLDAEGKLGALEPWPGTPEPEPEPSPAPEPAPPVALEPPKPRPPAPEPPTPASAEPASPAPAGDDLEALLPDEWRSRIDQVHTAEAVEVGGERVRRRVEEETVYLAVRVPRSLRDAIRRRSERLDVSIQEFVLHAARLLLEATARAAEDER